MTQNLWPLLILLGCASSSSVSTFEQTPYPYPNEHTIWGRRSQVRLCAARVPRARDDAGRVAPVVLLHPWGLDMQVWHQVAEAFAEQRDVILVDLPAHGKSSKLHSAYPMERLAGAVLDVMDDQKVERVVLIGNSMGAATALAVTQLAPERVEAMVLAGSPGGAPLAGPLEHLATESVNAEACASLSNEAWFVGLGVSGVKGPIRERFLSRRSAKEWPAWCRSALTVLRSVAEYRPRLETIRTPALVVHGEDDLVISKAQSQVLAKRLSARLVVLEGCGHLPELECPKAFVWESQYFLQDIWAAGH